MSETVKFRILYYIYTGHWLNRGILAATWLPNIGSEPVSHAELWESNMDGNFQFPQEYATGHGNRAIDWPYTGQCWTSTTRDDLNGTVVRPASEVLTHPNRWLYTEHEVDEFGFMDAKCQAEKRVHQNKGYSFRDLSRFVMPLWLLKTTGMADNEREICSEHVAEWLVDMGIFEKNTIPSPRRLLRDVVRATHSPVRRLVDDVICT